ncbi:MAG: hypothetical protein PVG07_02825 [Acidobacteriota bacterium]
MRRPLIPPPLIRPHRGTPAGSIVPALRVLALMLCEVILVLPAAPAAGDPGPDREPALETRQGLECFEQSIACGETVFGSITTEDCAIPDDPPFYSDIFLFDGVAGRTVTATFSASGFDPFLVLQAPDLAVVADSGDFAPGPGGGARVVYTLDETSPRWSLTASPSDPNVTGTYALTLECVEGPPGEGFFGDPQYPDFRFRVAIEPPGGPTIQGSRLDACQEDTVCVAGAVADRAELYIRILGPRPNGFLWPTLVRFTPSEVTVDVQQISTGETRTYVLEAVGPGDDDLSGLQDRTGFVP